MKRTVISAGLILAMLCGETFLIWAEDPQGLLANSTGKTVIKRISTERNLGTTFLIISKSGTTIVLDPYKVPTDIDPSKIDAIFITHGHPDHQDMKFQRAVKEAGGKVVKFEVGEYTVKDVDVSGIAAAHSSDEISALMPNNILYLLRVDGLRIVHMGDIGQSALTPEQMKTLAKVDVAFMQFENSYSNVSVENRKGFKVIEQLGPQVVIPTHTSEAANQMLSNLYGGMEVIKDVWAVCPEDLANGKKRAIDLK